MLQDTRYGLRLLLKQKSFSFIAILSLALGIGATTTVFSIVNAALFSPLPVKDADSLLTVNKPGTNGSRPHAVSYPDYVDYRDRNNIFSELLAWCPAQISLNMHDQVESVNGIITSGNYFSMLGVKPHLGRFFSAEEDRTPGAYPVVVLSYAFWQNRLGGATSAIGQTVKLNSHIFTIIDVTPKEFSSTYKVYSPSIYIPLMMQAEALFQPNIFNDRMRKYLGISGRLKDGVSHQQAQESLSLLDRQLEQAFPEHGESARLKNMGVELTAIGTYPGEIQLAIWGGITFLFLIVGFVLLIACANTAGMLLARATIRQREIALRLALGASRRRLIHQLLTESLILFFIASGLGIIFTFWMTRLVSKISLPLDIPFTLNAFIDWRVLLFTVLITLITGIAFGLAPALEASRVDLHTISKGAFKQGRTGSRLRNFFVVAQMALAISLLTGAGLLTRSLQYASTVYPGKNPETIIVAELPPANLGYDEARSIEFYQKLSEQTATLPGVTDVSITRNLFVAGSYNTSGLTIKTDRKQIHLETESNLVGSNYFKTLGVKILQGREFTHYDRKNSPRVVIINESLARQFGQGYAAIGQQVKYGKEWAEIVGIVENGVNRLAGQPSAPRVYWPYLQCSEDNPNMTFLVRHSSDMRGTLASVRNEIQKLDSNLPLSTTFSLKDGIEIIILPIKVMSLLAKLFSFFGLILAMIGIYGLVAYTVNQRIYEMGVRIAIGAQRRDIYKIVLSQGFKLSLWGGLTGLIISLVLAQPLSEVLFGISTSDPVTYLSVIVLLVLAAIVASFVPARRAASVNPSILLRSE